MNWSNVIPFINVLIKDMEDMDAWSIDGIVEKEEVTGGIQDDDTWGHVFIDQNGGGISGDFFYGQMYLPLSPEKYLKITYNC